MCSVKRLISLLLAACMLAGCALAEGTPTDITPPVTKAPTQAPTQAPTATPTQEVTAAPAGTPTPQPWDESACQHNTADCQKAPACDAPGCTHIVKDAHGLDIPACALGEWLLDAQEQSPIATISVRSNPVDLNTADATLYRSGTYRVSGGNLRPGASLTVVKGRVVVLEIEDATIGTLVAQKGSQLHIRLTGQSTLGTLNTVGENAVVFETGGALTISSISLKTEEAPKITFEVKGGSLAASLTEKHGRQSYSFDAAGAQSVTVDGQPYAATAHPDGKVYLWLPAPADGMKWDAAVASGVLAVKQVADLSAAGSVTPGQNNDLKAGAYALKGAVAAGTKLTIAVSGVTVALSDVSATGELISASAPYTLLVTGTNTVGTLAGSGDVTLQGNGVLTLDSAPSGYELFTVAQTLSSQKVTLDGKEHPLVISGGKLALPAGRTYAIVADAQTVTVHTVKDGEKAFTLTSATPYAEAGSANNFTVTGDGSFVSGSITASGATASASFHNVKLKGDGLLALTNEHLTVTLTGDNTLQSGSGKAVTLASGSTLVLNAASGRLALRGQNDLNGITLQGNILVEPATSLPHTVLAIRDKSGNAVPNKALTVTIGGQSWQYTTHADGSLHLWGLGDISGQEIVATDGESVYTAVIVNGQAQLTTGLTDFSDVTFASQADGSLLMSWSVSGAAVTGVQLMYGSDAIDMPDTYVAGAQRIAGKDFSAKATGIPAGSVVTVRVYASAQAGAVFSEETADGFQFSKIFTYVHRTPWTYDGKKGDADASYSGKAYQPKMELPETAEITYQGHDLVNGKPVYPGEYVMKVVIPEGDPKYLPGTVEISFTIKKRMITIVPGHNLQKYRGTSDPEFTWTAKGLLEGDAVTGVLNRESGEAVGEYKWLTDGFGFARDLYDIRIDPGAEPFLIMPYGGMLTIQVNEVMHPVEQTIILKDGRKLTVLLDAQESLRVTHSVLGSLVRGADDEARLFTPQLSWNSDTDEVLLMLRAEPEMNEDHGYQTDVMGNPLWGLRRIRVVGSGLEHMDRMGITALELINNDAALSCRIEDFLTDEMKDFVKENGGRMNNATFWLTVEPVSETPDEMRPVTGGWRVSATLVIGKEEIDVTEMLPSLTVSVSMEPVAELLTAMERYDEEQFPEQYVLSLADGTLLDATFVEPFAEDELEKVDFPTMMYVSRYLAAPLTAPGAVYAVSAPVEEEATPAE